MSYQNEFSRRSAVGLLASAAMASAMPKTAWAQSPTVVAAAFQGAMENVYKEVLAPALKQRDGAELRVVPGLTSEQMARLRSSPNNPPFDLVLLDDAQNEIALKEKLIQPFPFKFSRNHQTIAPTMAGRDGLAPMMFFWTVVIAYNPTKFKEPPKSWNDLWAPSSTAKVGLINVAAVIGQIFLAEQSRALGGDEKNVDPAFDIIGKNSGKLAAVAQNLGALASLFQQGEAEIGPMFLSDVLRLKARGVPIDFAVPETGITGARFGLNIVSKPEGSIELCADLVDVSLDPQVQKAIAAAPYFFIPAGKGITLEPAIADKFGTKTTDDFLAKVRTLDWSVINRDRATWIERFNKATKA